MDIKQYIFELGPIRPPSEGGGASLLLRFTRNCPWNHCTFCYGSPYGRRKFSLRSEEEIIRDIDRVQNLVRLIEDGRISHITDDIRIWKCLEVVYQWIRAGKRRVFLQDADSMIIKKESLVYLLNYLKEKFPSIERITTYARAKSLKGKSLDALREIYRAGLNRVHVGVESGNDNILKRVKKGVSSEEHLSACKKAKDAGMEVSIYIMPGLGGEEMSLVHARDTAFLINQMEPHYVRMRPFVPRIGTPLYKDWKCGNFRCLSVHGILKELLILIEELDFSGRICFDHMRNPHIYMEQYGFVPLFKSDYEGYKFPDEKGRVLERIEMGLEIKEERYRSLEQLLEIESRIYSLNITI